MQKRRHAAIALRVSISLSMLAAISIILGKYLAINVGEALRFSFENLPVIFAGIFFGPIAGMTVGALADLVGCLLVGYAINPVVTLGAVSIGLVSGLTWYLLKKAALPTGLTLGVSVALSHLLGSVLIKGAGLSAFYSMPFGILILWRLLNYLIVGALEGILLYFLIKSKTVRSAVSSIKRGGKQ